MRMAVRLLFFLILACGAVFPAVRPVCVAASDEVKSYSISLVKTADPDHEVHRVGAKKVLAEPHVVNKGEWIWQLLRERGLLEHRDLPEVISALKKLNPGLENIDLIQPGERILIPLKLVPVSGVSADGPVREDPLRTVEDLKDLKDLEFEKYRVRPGDSLIKVVKGRYRIPPDELYHGYLDLARRLNPAIPDLNRIYPGQVVRLPIYSAEVVRKPIETPVRETEFEGMDLGENPMAYALGAIFSAMGERWVQTGDHYIPLRSGGQLDLKGSAFPIINVSHGLKVIVDLNSRLPEKMARLIESTWEDYRVVRLSGGMGLRTALDKILHACGYEKVLDMGHPLELGGDISLRITGDWIIKRPTSPEAKVPWMVVNLVPGRGGYVPHMFKKYLETLGLRIIEFPPPGESEEEVGEQWAGLEVLDAGDGRGPLVEKILNLTGRPFSTHKDVPVYESGGVEFKLVIKADVYLEGEEPPAIIDLTGFSPEVLALMEERRFRYLSLSEVEDEVTLASKVLDFVGVPFEKGNHAFYLAQRKEENNIRVSLHGVIFQDADGKRVLATPLSLPEEIGKLLASRGFKVLKLSAS